MQRGIMYPIHTTNEIEATHQLVKQWHEAKRSNKCCELIVGGDKKLKVVTGLKAVFHRCLFFFTKGRNISYVKVFNAIAYGDCKAIDANVANAYLAFFHHCKKNPWAGLEKQRARIDIVLQEDEQLKSRERSGGNVSYI